MNIYVGNLPYNIQEDELKDLFAESGTVDSSKIISDKFSGKSKGYGFIEMPNEDEAKAAVEALNGTDVKGRNIKVNESKPKSGSGSGSGPGQRSRFYNQGRGGRY